MADMDTRSLTHLNRRSLLKATGAGLGTGLFAGCTGSDGGDGGGDGSDGADDSDGADGGTTGDTGDEGPITISAIEPLSGVFGMYGPRHLAGAEYAIQQWNSDGGVLGRELTMVQADSGAGAQEARNAYTRHVEEEGAVAGIGPGSSEVAIQVSRYAEQAQVPMLLHASGAVACLTEGKDTRHTFRTALPATPTSARAQAQIAEQNDLTEIGVIYEDGAWGREFKAGVEAYFPDEANFTEFTAPIPQSDFTSQLRQFPDDVEMVLGTAHPAGVSSMYPQMLELGIEPEVYPAAITATEVDFGAIGEAIDGPFASYNSPDVYSEQFKEIAMGFLEAMDGYFDMNQANGYVAIDLIAQAIEAAESAEPAEISAALHSNTFDTIYAEPVDYTEWGEVKNSVTIYNSFNVGETMEWAPDAGYALEEYFRTDPMPAYEPGELGLV